MAVPKRKTSPMKRNQRWHASMGRKGRAVKKLFLGVDSNSGSLHLKHHLSLKDGFYKGQKIINNI